MLKWTLLAALLVAVAIAAWPQAARGDGQVTVDEVARELISQCGSGMILADHDCAGARYMKATIQQLIDAGRTKEEILDYFVAIYGEQVLASPRKSGFGLTAWVIPLVAVLAGALVGTALIWVWTRRRPEPAAAGAPPSGDLHLYEDRVEEELRLLE